MKIDPKTGKPVRDGAAKRKDVEESDLPTEHLYNYYAGSLRDLFKPGGHRKRKYEGAE